MRVLLLGPVEALDDGDRPIAIAGTRLRALLARLAMEPGRVVHADVLTSALWGERPPAGAVNALQALVSRLRRAVGAGLVEGRQAGYRLVLEPADVDAFRFERLAAGRDSSDVVILREAEKLWRGPALADLREFPFAAEAAVRWEELRLSAAEDRLGRELAAGTDVLAELRTLTAAYPLAERLQGLLIRALYAAGRQADALETYERTRRVLSEELGVDPSAELTALQLEILRHDAELPTLRRRPPTNLRAQVTSFVGREDDLAQLAKAVAATRLVTIVGPGGAGKTRLALEAAARTTDHPDGVWLVELAAVTDPLDLAPTLLTAIGAREAPEGGDAVSRLEEFFGRRRALLVVDNCEHLVDAVAGLLDRLLGSCPQLRVLATSQESLAIGGEQLYPIRPLGWPDEEFDDPAAYPAIRLFTERTAAVRPDFVLDKDNAVAVVEICRRLDGMPLAIELAAARTRVLDAAGIAAKLDDRFALLNSGSRTAMPRHRTLRAVIEWSWALLAEAERELAMRLAVFPAGTTLDVLDGMATAIGDVLDSLTGLVDKSLVEHAGDRYRMLESIRSYGIERLEETGRGQAMREEQAQCLVRLVEAADAELRGAEQLRALARLRAERDNILAALRFAAETGDANLGIRLAAAMYWFWDLRGSLTERLHWTRAVLAIPGEPAESLRAVTHVLRGLMLFETGDIEAGERELAEGIGFANRLGLGSGPGGALVLIARASLPGPAAAPLDDHVLRDLSGWERGMALALSATDAGDAEAVDRLRQAEREFETIGERYGLSTVLRTLANHHQLRGDLPAAVDALTQAVRPIEELGVAGDRAEVFAELATALARSGELDRAGAAIREAWDVAEAGQETRTMAYVRMARGEFLICRGDHDAARRELDAAEAGLARTALETRARLWCAVFRAVSALVEDDVPAAREALDAALAPGLDDAEAADLAAIARMYAAAALPAGDAEQAAQLIGVAASLLGSDDRRGYDNLLRPAERAREVLGDKTFETAHDRGATMGRDAAITVIEAQSSKSCPGETRRSTTGSRAAR